MTRSGKGGGEYSLVAEVEERLVGAVVAEHQTIEFRGRGIGKRLMVTVLERGRRNGLPRSMVYSNS